MNAELLPASNHPINQSRRRQTKNGIDRESSKEVHIPVDLAAVQTRSLCGACLKCDGHGFNSDIIWASLAWPSAKILAATLARAKLKSW